VKSCITFDVLNIDELDDGKKNQFGEKKLHFFAKSLEKKS